MKFSGFFLYVLTMLCLGNAPAKATTSYHIGNSLTLDSQPLGIAALANSRGLQHQVGYHIRSSSSMHQILSHPEAVNEPPSSYGTFTTALSNNHWDYVTLQPYSDPLGNMGLELASMLSFINLTRSNPANRDTRFYIYQGWPSLGDYQSNWTAPTPDVLGNPVINTRGFYKNLINRVRANTDAEVYMVPVGEVLYELDVKMKREEISGFPSVNFLYRDTLHLSQATGRFVAGVTTFATLLAQYPNELIKPTGFYASTAGFTPEQSEVILETIREVLDRNPDSGVELPPRLTADFDANNLVDSVDLELWQTSFNKERDYDIDHDGDVDGRDFLTWQRNHRTSLGSEIIAAVDLNQDGQFNDADLQQWHQSYGIDAGGDVDGDGDTDGSDFLRWTRAFPGTIADSNEDYLVNEVELQKWQNSFGFNRASDADGDGAITGRDFLAWQRETGRHWTFPVGAYSPAINQKLVSAVPVPEPASWLLLGLFAVGRVSSRKG